MTKNYLPFALPQIEDEEIAEVIDTLKGGWLTTGPKTHAFEVEFAKVIGASYALAVNSATAGLHLALEAIGLQRDERVITTAWTFTATAEVIRYLDAHPIFVDIDPYTLNIDPERIAEQIDKHNRRLDKIRAILPVHFGGQACDMQAIMDLATTRDLRVVEDAAHAFPATVTSRSASNSNIKHRIIGTVADATVFSFYVTKTIATGEGGMVTTEDEEIADRIRLMRLHGINRDVWNRYTSNKPSWYYEVVAPGFKYNLSDIASAIGLQQLKKAMKFQDRREEIANAYSAAFSQFSQLQVPAHINPTETHSWHLYVLRLNLETLTIDRDRFIEEMSARGIGCSVHFIPLHLHPYWRDRYQLTPDMLPVATNEFKRVVSLPVYPKMTDEDVYRVIEAATDIVKKFKR
ncbi:MAG: DegT/DnrJ/EryC1/StrS aminotransferase family protein [Thermodesulfobacteriota bacterium]